VRTAGRPAADHDAIAIGVDDMPGINPSINRSHPIFSAGRPSPVRAALLIADDHGGADVGLSARGMTNPLTNLPAALSQARLPALVSNSALNSCLDSARQAANREGADTGPVAMRVPGLVPRHHFDRVPRGARRCPMIETAAVIADDRRVSDTMLLVMPGLGLGRNRCRDRNDRDCREN